MAAFLVVALAPNPGLDQAIARAYEQPGSYLSVSENAWLIADSGGVTTKDVCDKINAKVGGFVNVIVVKVESYFGVAAPNIWEWLKLKLP